jgi:undecaprenyl-diphosphatase
VLDALVHIDQSLFLALNGLHTPFFDQFFWYATKPILWLPLYLLIFVLLVRSFRWKTITIVIAVALMIAVSDQLANVSKDRTQRLRPSHEPEIEQLVHSVNDYKGGQYGFFSAHASTNFAIALFFIFFLRRRYRWMVPILLVWATIMAYSRLYLGVHYPGDILAGILVGVILGSLFVWLTGYAIAGQTKCEQSV